MVLSGCAPPFCSAFSSESVCTKLLQDTGNRWLMCAGVPKTVGSARRREKDQAGRGSGALALKNERPGTPFPDLLYRLWDLGPWGGPTGTTNAARPQAAGWGWGSLPLHTCYRRLEKLQRGDPGKAHASIASPGTWRCSFGAFWENKPVR